MKKIWISNCTEYESGWGQRSDGCMISDDEGKMLKEIEKENQKGNPDYFWRYEKPRVAWCSNKTFKGIKSSIKENGVTLYGDAAKYKLELFNKFKF